MNCRNGLPRLGFGQPRLPLKPDHIASGITKRRDHLARVRHHWLDDLTACRDNRVERRRGAGDHDVPIRPGSVVGGRPGTQAPLTSLTVSSNAVDPSPRVGSASRRHAGRTPPTGGCPSPESRCNRSGRSEAWVPQSVRSYLLLDRRAGWACAHDAASKARTGARGGEARRPAGYFARGGPAPCAGAASAVRAPGSARPWC